MLEVTFTRPNSNHDNPKHPHFGSEAVSTMRMAVDAKTETSAIRKAAAFFDPMGMFEGERAAWAATVKDLADD